VVYPICSLEKKNITTQKLREVKYIILKIKDSGSPVLEFKKKNKTSVTVERGQLLGSVRSCQGIFAIEPSGLEAQ